MAKSNRSLIGDALDKFREGMMPFCEQQLKGKYGDEWEDKVRDVIRKNPATEHKADEANINWDVSLITSLISTNWQYLFRYQLDTGHRAMIHETSDVRNRWAHQKPFSTDDTLRALDTIHRSLSAVGAGDQAADIDAIKQSVMRSKFQELTNKETKSAKAKAIDGKPLAGLTPWRDIITPHPDVASGRFFRR